MIDLGEKRYLTYCVRLSCDGGKTWVFTNGGGTGYGNGGEYIGSQSYMRKQNMFTK